MSDARPARHNRPSRETTARAATRARARDDRVRPAPWRTFVVRPQSERRATLSDKKLRDMLACASDFCERRFERDGAIEPMWHAVTASGESLVERARPD